MTSEVRNALDAQRKLIALQYAKGIGNVGKACHDLGVARSSFYRWKNAFAAEGRAGLARKKPIARSHPRQIPREFVEKILWAEYSGWLTEGL